MEWMKAKVRLYQYTLGKANRKVSSSSARVFFAEHIAAETHR